MAVWNESIEDELINLIQDRPALYDITEKRYANRAAKVQCWREIEDKLVISEKELRKRWDSLRTQFMRYKRLQPSGSCGAPKTGRQQWILNRLQFLEPHTKKRESTSNLNIEESSAQSASCSPLDGSATDTWTPDERSMYESEQQPGSPLAESTICSEEPIALTEEPLPGTFIEDSTMTTPRARKRSRKMVDDSSSEESTHLMRTIGQTLKKLASKENHSDGISAYCRNLEHRMRSLPQNVLPHFQNEVDNLVFKYLVGQGHQ